MREWVIRLALLSLGFIIGIVALEFGLSIFVPNPKTFHSEFLYAPDRYIGWKGDPGKEGYFVTAVQNN